MKKSGMNDAGTISMPPVAEDIERAVIGVLLNNLSEFETYLDLFDETMFYGNNCRIIFSTIFSLWKKDERVDLLAVHEHMKASGLIEMVGGSEAFWGITSDCFSTANMKYWSDVLKDKKRLREIAILSRQIQLEIEKGNTDSKELLNRLQEGADNIGGEQTSSGVKKISDCIQPTMSIIEKRSQSKTGITGIPTGFPLLDKATAGWQPGSYIVLAAQTKAGKSALGLSFALTAASAGYTTVIYSIEMTETEITERSIAYESQVETAAVHYKPLVQAEWTRISDACQKIHDLPLYLDSTPGLNITELSAKAKRMKQKHDISFAIVDYMQLMGGTGELSRQLQVENISRGLKRLAMSLGIPIIGISQFSRPIKGQEKKRPILSDLRDSGAIEQDANVVIFIHDPEEDRKREHLTALHIPERDIPMEELREIIIAANRQGPTIDMLARWQGYFYRFSNPC